jgi:hypothetical protein
MRTIMSGTLVKWTAADLNLTLIRARVSGFRPQNCFAESLEAGMGRAEKIPEVPAHVESE